jgi:hypothetical protein
VPSVVIGGIGTLLVVALWMRLFRELARVDAIDAVHPSTPGSASDGRRPTNPHN